MINDNQEIEIQYSGKQGQSAWAWVGGYNYT